MNSIFNIFYPRRPPAFFKKQFYNGGRRWRLGQFRTERLFVTLLVRDSNHSPTPENPGANNTSLIYLGGNPVISNSVPSASKSSFLRRRKQINIIYTQTLETTTFAVLPANFLPLNLYYSGGVPVPLKHPWDSFPKSLKNSIQFKF